MYKYSLNCSRGFLSKGGCQRSFVRAFCTRPTKDGGSEMCDVLLGVLGCVTKCDREKGGQNWRDVIYGRPRTLMIDDMITVRQMFSLRCF